MARLEPRPPAADLRLGGAWTPLQRAKNDALWAAARLALAVTRPLPLETLRALGRLLGRTAHALCPAARRMALDNVSLAFPELEPDDRRTLVRQCFATLGACLGETVALLHAGGALRPLPVDPAARELLAAARQEGRGVVFASAHLGPWERVAGSLVAAGVPLVTIARESYDPRFSALYERLRSAQGVRVVWRATPGAAARILRTLRDGDVLGVPMDLRSRVPSHDVLFFGRRAPTALGPARIALRTGAAVVVGSAAPAHAPTSVADTALTVTATRIETHDLPRGSAGVLELTARINRELQRRIRDLPHAWVWMHERWPAGRAS